MLNDEAASLRISGSPVHKRVSKPNLGDVNPSVAAIARHAALAEILKTLTTACYFRVCSTGNMHGTGLLYCFSSWSWSSLKS